MRRSLWAAAILLALLILTGCKVEVDHLFEEDGSSIWQFGLGDEINPDDGESIDCTPDEEGPFPVLYANLSQRGAETWCTTGFALDSPVELAYLYASFNEDGEFFRVNCLSVEDGHLVYDIEVLLDSSGVEEGDSLIWRVTAPGEITSTNADSQSGNTATWNLTQRNGWTSLQLNAGGADCPSAGVTLNLVAETPTTGTALISAAKPTTTSADADAISAALSSAGWQVADHGTEISASRTWSDAAELQSLADNLALLEGSDLSIATNDDGETSFEAHIDLSFYEAFWQGINPAIDDPPFRLSWTPPEGSTESTGDWTDPDAHVFTWTVDNAGRIFNMATVTVETPPADTDPEEIVSEPAETDPDDLDDTDGPDDIADVEAESEAETAATEALVDELAGDDADDATRAATTAAVVAMLAAAGLTALSVAESGMSIGELLESLRNADRDGQSSTTAEEIRIWDESTGQARVFDSHEDAERFAEELRRRDDQQFARDTADAMDASGEIQDAANAEELADIRADRAAIEYWTQLVRAREEALARLEAAEAEQAGIRDEGWQRIVDESFDGMVTELDALPDEIRDAAWATRQALDAVAAVVADPDNYDVRVLAETALETLYDALGIMAGGAFGDGLESVATPVTAVARVGGALADMAWNDFPAFVEMITPIGDLRESMDPDNTLGTRLGHMGFALADIIGTLAGVGFADEIVETSRLVEATDDARRTTAAATESLEASRLASKADELVETQRAAEALNPSKFAEPTVAARREAWEQARREGRQAVDEAVEAFTDLAPDDLARREAALRVQGNKQALMEMKGKDVPTMSSFNDEMREIYDATDDQVIDWLMDPKTRPDGLPDFTPPLSAGAPGPDGRITTYFDADGNSIRLFEPTNADPTKISVGADRDFTVYVAGQDGVERAVASGDVAPVYNQAFYDASGGDEMARSLGIEPDADAFAARMDQAITDDVHPEAYKNVNTVINEPGKAIGDVEQVGQASAYKHDHWQQRAMESSEKATAAAEAGDDAAAAAWAAIAEDERFEGMRQLVKQNENQINARHAALVEQVEEAKRLGTLPADYKFDPTPPDNLQRAMEIMDEAKTVGKPPVDIEMELLSELGMTPTDVAHRMGDYLESMETLRPQAIIDIQRGL